MGSLCGNYAYRLVNLLENRRKMVETYGAGKWNKAGINDLAGRLNHRYYIVSMIKRDARTPFRLFMHDKGYR